MKKSGIVKSVGYSLLGALVGAATTGTIQHKQTVEPLQEEVARLNKRESTLLAQLREPVTSLYNFRREDGSLRASVGLRADGTLVYANQLTTRECSVDEFVDAYLAHAGGKE